MKNLDFVSGRTFLITGCLRQGLSNGVGAHGLGCWPLRLAKARPGAQKLFIPPTILTSFPANQRPIASPVASQ